ncbi:PP2C family protein-serine/threonine phosphatase [Sediminitomix flava]|uniref:Serine phosphatase RsbU (Regulator of sigma subunit) n=1 Tax=Sediminitomix flava TaxID=379075 RepID=A0A315ZHJ7_SEDFL|nr:SpoIIE family protein phosphatase [Sediminitomix flava]PWJ45085.1 serine phosphatase RsbU (regulator of sigma subunit) [Sediminitomix flava]
MIVSIIDQLTNRFSDEVKLDAILVFFILFLSSSCSALYAGYYFFVGLRMVSLAFIYLSFFAGVIFYLYYERIDILISARLYGLVTLTGFSFITTFTGGVHSPLIAFQLITPIGVTLIAKRKESFYWSGLLMLWGGILILEESTEILHFSRDLPNVSYLGISCFIGLFIYIISIIWGYEIATEKYQGQINDKNHELYHQNVEIELQNQQLDVQNNRIISSINYAKKIQDAVLHYGNKIEDSFKDAFIFYRPRDIVSGDFFCIEHEENKKIVVAADCTGHGVPGAILSLVGMNLIRSIIHEKKVLSPDQILFHLRESLYHFLNQEKSQSRDGMDISICVVDDEYVEIASAKSTVYTIQNNTILSHKGDNISIGGLGEEYVQKAYQLERIERRKIDFIYMCSDGFQDQFGGPKDMKFMKKNFRNLLLTMYTRKGEEQLSDLEQTFKNWKGAEEQTDDILVLGFAPN